MNAYVDAGDGMTSNPSSLTDLKGQVAMSITLGMVLDDGTKESTGGGIMSNNALLGGDEGNRRFLHILSYSKCLFLSYGCVPPHKGKFLSGSANHLLICPVCATIHPCNASIYQGLCGQHV